MVRMCRTASVAGARLALGADHCRPFGDTPARLSQVARAADEGDGEPCLVDVALLVGRGENLALVDVVDLERLEQLRLDEVTDAHLGHDGNGHGALDLPDQTRVGHAGDTPFLADIRRHPLEGHDGHGTGLLGNGGLLRRGHVHDDAALEHLRQLGVQDKSFTGQCLTPCSGSLRD